MQGSGYLSGPPSPSPPSCPLCSSSQRLWGTPVSLWICRLLCRDVVVKIKPPVEFSMLVWLQMIFWVWYKFLWSTVRHEIVSLYARPNNYWRWFNHQSRKTFIAVQSNIFMVLFLSYLNFYGRENKAKAISWNIGGKSKQQLNTSTSITNN